MNRGTLISSLCAALLVPTAGSAEGVSTIVTVTSNVPELEEQAEDTLAGALRERHVNTVDPSAIDETYHQEARLAIVRMFRTALFSYSSIAWVERRYGARRLLAAELKIESSSLPYGDYTVTNVRARCSCRAFDTVNKRLVFAGSVVGGGRSEDETTAQEQALESAMLALAKRASRYLV